MFRWRHDPPGAPSTVDPTGWLDAPSEAWPSRILAGVLMPVGLFALGIYFVSTEQAVLPGRIWHHLSGRPAIAMGVAVIGAAIFLHAHAFWGPVYRLAIVHQLGRIVGAAVFILGFGYVLISLLWI